MLSASSDRLIIWQIFEPVPLNGVMHMQYFVDAKSDNGDTNPSVYRDALQFFDGLNFDSRIWRKIKS